MVFESIVVDVLNRFLGNYVENLNRSQLKLGIWGGDVVLENLILKANALEELNIPVQTVYGSLGKLVLKIPWQNLYGAAVEASIEGLILLVSPTAEIKYDAEKEEKMALASKKAELARVEEAKKKEAEKDANKLDETFVEKLVTQIIKNVQLKIKDIHIRYEDSITNPKAPFSLGITLHNLSVHTTDENWRQTIIQDNVTKIYKILNLEALAFYWNPTTDLYSKLGVADLKNKLKSDIATKTFKPDYYQYELGPINSTAKLKLNPKPEADAPKFGLPKIILSLHMEQLSVNLTKAQYQDMMLLADSMDRMSKGAPYRKYRPDLQAYRGHYKEWWHFAYTCVLEEEVKRQRRNWDWTHMLSHRQLCKDYAKVYQCWLSNKGKVSNDQKCILDQAEKRLDLFNLVVIRQKIEMEAPCSPPSSTKDLDELCRSPTLI